MPEDNSNETLSDAMRRINQSFDAKAKLATASNDILEQVIRNSERTWVPLMSGSVANLEQEVKAIRDTVNSTAVATLIRQQPAMAAEIQSINDRLNKIDTDVLPKLHEVHEFITRDAELMTNAVVARSRIEALLGQFSSLERRVHNLEEQREKAWNRSTTKWVIAIAVLTMIATAAGAAVPLILEKVSHP